MFGNRGLGTVIHLDPSTLAIRPNSLQPAIQGRFFIYMIRPWIDRLCAVIIPALPMFFYKVWSSKVKISHQRVLAYISNLSDVHLYPLEGEKKMETLKIAILLCRIAISFTLLCSVLVTGHRKIREDRGEPTPESMSVPFMGMLITIFLLIVHQFLTELVY